MARCFSPLFLLVLPSALFAQADDPVAAVRLLIERGEWEKALNESAGLLKDRTAKLGNDDPQTQAARHVHGLALLALGRHAEAQTHFETIRADKKLPADHPVALCAANDLAVALYRQAKYEPARDLLREVVPARAKTLGPDHPDTLQSLRNLAFAEYKGGDFAVFQKLLRQCFETTHRNINDHVQVLRTTSAEVEPLVEPRPDFPRILIVRGIYAPGPKERKLAVKKDEAAGQLLERLGFMARHLADESPWSGIELLQKSHRLHKILYGEDDLRSQVSLFNSQPLDKELAVLAADWEKKLPEHPWLAHVQIAQGLRHETKVEGFKILGQAFLLRQKIFGKDHPLTANVIEAQAVILQNVNLLEGARIGFQKALEIRAEKLGPRHPETAQAHAALGVLLYYRGEFALARTHVEKGLAIRTEKLGKDHVDSARSAADHAILLREEGDFAAARQTLEGAVVTLEKVLGPFNAEFQAIRGNLEVLRLEMGDYDTATRYFTEVYKSEKTPLLARQKALLNLGTIARAKGELNLAQKIFEEALTKENSDPFILNNLGAILRDQGELDRAEKYLCQALDAHTGRQTPAAAFSLTSLGLLAQKKGKWDEASDFFSQALVIYRGSLGEASQSTADLLQLLGTSQLLAGDKKAASKNLEQALAIKVRIARDLLPTMSEAEALAFAAALEERDPLLDAFRGDESQTVQAYLAVWKTRSLATRAITARRQVVSLDPKVRPLWDQLRAARRQLAALVRLREKGFTFGTFDPSFDRELKTLNERKEKIEQQLALVLKGQMPADRLLSAGPEDLFKLLPPGVAVVDLIQAKSRTRTEKGSSTKEVYEAFILRGGEKTSITWVNLGPAAPIDEQVGAWRSFYGNSTSGARGLVFRKPPKKDGADAGQKLRGLVWDRLAPALDGCTTVVVIGDGTLHRLPWGALPGKEPGTFLLEDIAIATASHGPQLVALLKETREAAPGVLLAGGITYDKAAPKSVAGPSYRGIPVDEKTRSGWTYLPGTAKEVQLILKLADPDAKRIHLKGEEATPGALRSLLPQSGHIHLATHGYFAPPGKKAPWDTPEEPRETDLATHIYKRLHEDRPFFESITGRNPLILSGLVLAGANRADRDKGDDGILTAEEIVDLPLGKTDLVVLSACETGLGEVASGEGVLGLQRAFALAGARTTIGSLWQVDDAATQALMVEFYGNLWHKKMGKLEALRQAQLTVLRRFDPKEGTLGAAGTDGRVQPYYWAAFVLQGDWR